MTSSAFVKSLGRGLGILEIFGNSTQRLTLTDVAKLSKLNKTATMRFLQTLCALGYLKRDVDKKYFLSTKILSLSFGFFNTSKLRSISKPHVDDLSSDLNKTVNLAILDDYEALYLYRKEVVRYLKYDLYDGSRLPAYCTSVGKVLLAGLDDSELKKRISGMNLKPITTKTITSKITLWNDIMGTRKRGYSICDRELSMDLYSMAVPLINDKGKVVAAINATMDARDGNSQMRKIVLEKLIQKGRLISELLGYRGPYPKL